MHIGDIDFRVLHFDQLVSSNIHAQEMIKKGEIRHADVIWTDFQAEGKGQKSRRWDSKPSENLLFSLYLQLNWPADQLFQLNKMASLALGSLLVNLAVPEVSIKWPNDILTGTSKLCGILIENSIQANKAVHTIIGVGLNVNQIDFPSYERSANSLAKVLGHSFNRKELLQLLLNEFKIRIEELFHDQTKLNKDYEEMLYGFRDLMEFETQDQAFKAIILGVDQHGRLILQRGEEKEYFDLKEIRFLA